MRSPAAPPLMMLAVLGLAVLGAAVLGLASSSGQLLLVAVLAAPLGLVAVLAMRLEWVVGLLLVSAWIVGGSLAYFAGVGQAQWLPVGVGLALYAVLLFRMVGNVHRSRRPGQPLIWIAGLFVMLAVATTAWSGVGFVQWLYGVRFYLGIGSLMLVLAYFPLPAAVLQRVWQGLLIATVVQLPVVLYQFLFVARRRAESSTGGLSFDSIVGTMGGNQEAGGHSAALGFFVLAGLVLAMTLWKRGLVRPTTTLVLACVVVAVIFLAEIKFYGLLLPLALLLIFRAQFFLRPRNLLVGVALGSVVILGMPTVYSALHYAQSSWANHPTTVVEFYEWMFSRADPTLVSQYTGEMGRVTQLVFWSEQNDWLSRPKEFLLGHGMGSTSISQFGAGDVARRYFPLQVGTSTAVVMLWEVGVLGLLVAIAGLLLAAFSSLKLARHAEVPVFHRASLEAGFVIALIAIPALFYKFFALESPAIQALMFLVVGQACYWRSHVCLVTDSSRGTRGFGAVSRSDSSARA